MKSDGCDLVVLGTVIRETIGAMAKPRSPARDVTFLRRDADQACWKCLPRQGSRGRNCTPPLFSRIPTND